MTAPAYLCARCNRIRVDHPRRHCTRCRRNADNARQKRKRARRAAEQRERDQARTLHAHRRSTSVRAALAAERAADRSAGRLSAFDRAVRELGAAGCEYRFDDDLFRRVVDRACELAGIPRRAAADVQAVAR